MQSCGSSVRDSLKIARRVVDEQLRLDPRVWELRQALPLPVAVRALQFEPLCSVVACCVDSTLLAAAGGEALSLRLSAFCKQTPTSPRRWPAFRRLGCRGTRLPCLP
jgi:hypothetical protein